LFIPYFLSGIDPVAEKSWTSTFLSQFGINMNFSNIILWGILSPSESLLLAFRSNSQRENRSFWFQTQSPTSESRPDCCSCGWVPSIPLAIAPRGLKLIPYIIPIAFLHEGIG
jgi:hypothetical protein